MYLLGQLAGLVWARHDLVVEHREVQGKSQPEDDQLQEQEQEQEQEMQHQVQQYLMGWVGCMADLEISKAS